MKIFYWPRYIARRENTQVISRPQDTSTVNVIQVQSSAYPRISTHSHSTPTRTREGGQDAHIVVFAQTGQILVVLVDTLLVGLYPLLGQALLHLLQPALLKPSLGLSLSCVRIIILFLPLLLWLLRRQCGSCRGAGGFGFGRGGLLFRLLFFLLLYAACNCAFELERAACRGESAKGEIGTGHGAQKEGQLYLSTRSPLFPSLLLLRWSGRRFSAGIRVSGGSRVRAPSVLALLATDFLSVYTATISTEQLNASSYYCPLYECNEWGVN